MSIQTNGFKTRDSTLTIQKTVFFGGLISNALKRFNILVWYRRNPPSIIPACDPMSDHDLVLATDLTKAPIDLNRDTSTDNQQPWRSVSTETDEEETSIPLVDEWIKKAFMSLSHYLDWILDTSIIIYDLALNFVTDIADKTKVAVDYLRRVMVISTLVKGDTTTVTIDFMLTRGAVLMKDGVPVIVATGPRRRIKKLCCTPVRYIPAKPVPKKQKSRKF